MSSHPCTHTHTSVFKSCWWHLRCLYEVPEWQWYLEGLQQPRQHCGFTPPYVWWVQPSHTGLRLTSTPPSLFKDMFKQTQLFSTSPASLPLSPAQCEKVELGFDSLCAAAGKASTEEWRVYWLTLGLALGKCMGFHTRASRWMGAALPENRGIGPVLISLLELRLQDKRRQGSPRSRYKRGSSWVCVALLGSQWNGKAVLAMIWWIVCSSQAVLAPLSRCDHIIQYTEALQERRIEEVNLDSWSSIRLNLRKRTTLSTHKPIRWSDSCLCLISLNINTLPHI